MKQKKQFTKIFIIIFFALFFLGGGLWKWVQIKNEKTLLEKEIKSLDQTALSTLTKISTYSSEKSAFVLDLVSTNKWPDESLKKDLLLLTTAQLKNQSEFDQWDQALSRISNFIAEHAIISLKQGQPKNEKKGPTQSWLRNMEVIDKKLEDSRQSYELTILKRMPLIQKYQLLPWVHLETFEKFPSASLYQEALKRKMSLKVETGN